MSYHIKLEYPKDLGVTMGYSGGYVSFTASSMNDMYTLIDSLRDSLLNQEEKLNQQSWPGAIKYMREV